MWGQVNQIDRRNLQLGIIPTRVGTSTSAISPLSGFGDHPHACGDKLHRLIFSFSRLGSSPRVWGQVIICKLDNGNVRIIPTRVGTRKTTHTDTRTDEDHPHACGDKYLTLGTHIKMTGSSPRVWGQEPVTIVVPF